MKLLVCIVNEGYGEKVIGSLEEYKILCPTVIKCYGCSSRKILNLLGLESSDRDLLMMLLSDDNSDRCIEDVTSKFNMDKRGKGIIFTVDINTHLEQKEVLDMLNDDKKTQDEFAAIVSIVNYGEAEKVMDIARKYGANGGTIIHGRGCSKNEIVHIFNFDIEVEKEVLLMIVNRSICSTIIRKVCEDLRFNEVNSGVIFSYPISEVHGLFEKEQQE